MVDAKPNRIARATLALLGVLLMAAAWPLAFLAAVFAGGGHSSPFGHDRLEAVFGIALLGVPALLFLVGISLVRASFTGRLRLAAGIALLLPLDIGIAAAALWTINQPEPPVIIPPPDPTAVIPAARGPSGQPVIAVAACYPGHGCTTQPPSGPEESRPIEVRRR